MKGERSECLQGREVNGDDVFIDLLIGDRKRLERRKALEILGRKEFGNMDTTIAVEVYFEMAELREKAYFLKKVI